MHYITCNPVSRFILTNEEHNRFNLPIDIDMEDGEININFNFARCFEYCTRTRNIE